MVDAAALLRLYREHDPGSKCSHMFCTRLRALLDTPRAEPVPCETCGGPKAPEFPWCADCRWKMSVGGTECE